VGQHETAARLFFVGDPRGGKEGGNREARVNPRERSRI